MSDWKNISPEELTGNPFRMVGRDWMLITSADPGEDLTCGTGYNTMTASWGGMGILWGKPVVFAFIRPQRHTFGFAGRNERMTMSFFGGGCRDALNLCGTKSGRELDKAAAAGLTPEEESDERGRAVWFREAETVFVTRKLYERPFDKAFFLDEGCRNIYGDDDLHTVYVCEIEKILVKA